MFHPALTTRRRSLAAVAVLLFTLLTLAAAAPHEHSGTPHARSGVNAAAAPCDAPGGCPICDALASPRLFAPAPGIVLWTAALLPLLFPPLCLALLPSPSPLRRSRAPPTLAL